MGVGGGECGVVCIGGKGRGRGSVGIPMRDRSCWGREACLAVLVRSVLAERRCSGIGLQRLPHGTQACVSQPSRDPSTAHSRMCGHALLISRLTMCLMSQGPGGQGDKWDCDLWF